MKAYNITNRISAKAKREINRVLSTHEKYAKSYFFHPSSNSGGRRRNEASFASDNPDVKFVKGNDTIEVSMTYEESCKNVYYRINISVNGVSKDIRAIKSLLNN